MEEMDCLVPFLKDGKSVLHNPAAIARRKRMEIRRFRKFSLSTNLLAQDSKPNQTCHNLKRGCPSIDESSDLEADTERRYPKLQKEQVIGSSQTVSNDFLTGIEQYGLLQLKPQDEEASGYVNSKGKETVEFPENSDCLIPKLLHDYKAGLSSLNATPLASTTMVDIGEASGKLKQKASESDLQKPFLARQEDAVPDDVRFQGKNYVEVYASTVGASSSLHDVVCTSHEFTNQGFPPSGKLLLCGAKRGMEDRAAIVPLLAQVGFNPTEMYFSEAKMEGKSSCYLHFYAVYDGHGSSQASQLCMERLHLVLAEELTNLSDVKGGNKEYCFWKNVMTACFSRMDKELGGFYPIKQWGDAGSSAGISFNSTAVPESVGLSAVVVILSLSQVIIASCGDSKAVVSRGGKAILLSLDCMLESEGKLECIEPACVQPLWSGAQGIGCCPAVCEAIGGQYLKHFAASVPEVRCVQRSEEDESLILASNGLWDVISNEMACEIAGKCLDSSRKMRESGTYEHTEDPASIAAAALLVKVALARGSKDNISVIVVDLKKL